MFYYSTIVIVPSCSYKLSYSFAAWSRLTCFCQNSRLCDGDMDVCDNDMDVCFTQIAYSETTKEAVYEYGCIGHFDLFLANRDACLQGPVGNDLKSKQCCNNTNLCNRDLHPPLPPILATITTDRDSAPTNPTTPGTGPVSGTGMGLRHDQSIPCIPV